MSEATTHPAKPYQNTKTSPKVPQRTVHIPGKAPSQPMNSSHAHDAAKKHNNAHPSKRA